jgi:hypothetical protein
MMNIFLSNPKKVTNMMVLILAIAALAGLLLFAPLPTGGSWGWDVAIFRAGARALLAGQNPYLPANIPLFADGAELATIPYYTYSPVFGALLAPLAALSPWLAFRAWFLGNLALYFASIVLIIKAIGWNLSSRKLVLLMLAMAAFAPLRTLLIIGQSGIVMLFFLSLSFWLLKRGRPGWAGAAISLAFFKPHLVLLIPFFMLRRQWRLLAAFAVATGLAILPFLSLVDDWVRTVFSTRGANIQFGCLPFSSLPMFLKCTMPDFSPWTWIQWTILFIVGGGVLWLIWEPADPVTHRFDLQFTMVILASLLLIDNIRVADQVLAVFAIIVLLHEISQLRQGWLRRVLVALVMAAYLLPYIADGLSLGTKDLMWTQPVWYTITTLMLFSAVATLIISERLRNRVHEMEKTKYGGKLFQSYD